MSQKLKEEWWTFHKENPHVYELFENLALKAINKGRKRFSSRTIVELIRWHYDIQTNDMDFKINDHHVPYYARLFMHKHPKHEGFFETRQLKG